METLSYETKCRKCGIVISFIASHNIENITHNHIEAWKSEKISFPIIDFCTSCNHETVQDIISFYDGKLQCKKVDIELFVQEYFGLKPDVKEDFEIVTDFGIIVNLLAMFKDK